MERDPKLMSSGEFDKSITIALHRAVAAFSSLPNQGENNYGYFTLRDGLTGQVLLMRQIGTCPLDRVDKCFQLSIEKGERLYKGSKEGFVSSWQTRDIKSIQRGGAIYFPHLILSFAGVPELGDEAIVLSVAMQMEWLSFEEAEHIALISKNNFFYQLPKER